MMPEDDGYLMKQGMTFIYELYILDSLLVFIAKFNCITYYMNNISLKLRQPFSNYISENLSHRGYIMRRD